MKARHKKAARVYDSRWVAYATAATATATATALSGVSSAEASIVYSGPLNLHFPPFSMVDVSLGPNALLLPIHIYAGATAGGAPWGEALLNIRTFSPSLTFQSFAGHNAGPFYSFTYVAKLDA